MVFPYKKCVLKFLEQFPVTQKLLTKQVILGFSYSFSDFAGVKLKKTPSFVMSTENESHWTPLGVISM